MTCSPHVGVSIAAKLITGVTLGAIVAIACIKLAATRSRNARLTPIRYIAPSPSSVLAPIVDRQSTSRATTYAEFTTLGRWQRES